MLDTTTSECQCTTQGTLRALGSVKAHSAELLGMCRCSMSGFTRSMALPRACRKPSAMGA